MDLFDDEQVTTADQIDRPERAIEKQAIIDFIKRNPQADGGRIKFKDGTPDTSPVKTDVYKYPRSNRFRTVYSKTPGKNQYEAMRDLKDVQKAIDNAPPIEIDGKLFEQNKKDLRGDSEFSGKQVVTRKEQDKYGDKLKYKSSGKKRIVPVTQAYYDRRARELAKSNPTILKKLSGKGGYQLSHLSLSELDSLKNLGYLPAEINLKQYFPFEKKIVEISQQVYETQNNKKLSIEEKRAKIAELQKKDRTLRKQFPEFAKTKARLNVRATGLDSSGLMIKEKLPDPSIAIAPTEAGTQLKGTAVGSEKGKALLDFGKNNLQKLAVIGCGPKAARTGGRIGLNEGQNLQTCALKGIEKLKGDPGKLTSGDQANLRAISKSAKAARLLKNFLGPAAIAGEVLIEGGIAANKFMSEGVPIKQALGQSYLNYLLGPKTKIDVEAERAKEFAKGEDFAMAKRGERMAPFMAQSKEADAQRLKKREQEMQALYPQLDFVNLSNKEIDKQLADSGVYSPYTLGFGMQQRQPGIRDNMKYNEDLAYDELREYFNRMVDKDIKSQQMQTTADAGGVSNLAKGGRAGFKFGTRKGVLSLIDKSVKSTPKDTTSTLDKLIKETLDKDFLDKKDRIIDTLNVKAARDRKKYSYNQKVQEEPSQLNFYDDIVQSNFKDKTGPFFDYQKRKNKAGGGILKQAGDSSGPPPESGPNSQGLQGLMKRGMKI